MFASTNPAAFAQAVDPRRVFVYGTLRAGGSRDIRRLQPQPCWLGRGRVRGRLYDLGDYPGLVCGEDGWVLGEVYGLSAALEVVLDAIEEVWPQRSGEYLKRCVPVTMEAVDGASEPPRVWPCLLYEIHPSRVAACHWIEAGDWIAARGPAV